MDLPPNEPAVREITAWVERGGGNTGGLHDQIKFNPASCEKIRDFPVHKETGLGKFGPLCDPQGVAVEWVEIEEPIYEQWPPADQVALFVNLPVKEWTKENGLPKPAQQTWPRGGGEGAKDIYGGDNQRRPVVHVVSAEPEEDARHLLATFLRGAFRRPVTEPDAATYAEMFSARFKAGEHSQDALRAAYRAALVSPNFLLLGGTGHWPVPPADARTLLRRDFLNDATDAVGEVFLGVTLGCARCHDHKYDIIRQKDYYLMQAFFAGASTSRSSRWSHAATARAPFICSKAAS